MLSYFSDPDESYIVGVFTVSLESDYICRKILEITGIELWSCNRSHFKETGDFSGDTVIILKNQFEEDMLELLEYGISIFITDIE